MPARLGPRASVLCAAACLAFPIAAGIGLAADQPGAGVRGVTGDTWADLVVGQPGFGQITPNEVTSARVFNPGGVIVDRSVRPARVYVYDGGNSRVLGLSHLGHVGTGAHAGEPCTSDSDAPGSYCVIDQGRGADLVLGQPDFAHSGCNGDGAFQAYPVRARASASTLCSMPVDQVSPLEGGSFADMAVDRRNGDLYVPDFDNHRVLLYRSPFTTDTVADAVWGQADFGSNDCNRGRGVGSPDAQSLCFRSPSNEGFVAGVGLSRTGDLWVADNQNNRVLRFPRDPATGLARPVADLVLGQPGFRTASPGTALDRMHAPAAVRVDADGIVYVADSLNGRVLVFDPPLRSGMAATRTVGSGFRIPTGLELDPGTGGIWVSDRQNQQLLLYVGGQLSRVLLKDVKDDSGRCGGPFVGDGPNFYSPAEDAFIASYVVCDAGGSIGIDADGDVLVSGSSITQDVWRFKAPFPAPQRGVAHSADARIFPPFQSATHNDIGPRGIYSARGVAVANGQLIVADSGRLLVWNNPPAIASGAPADAIVGAPNGRVDFPPAFGRIRNDDRGRLWAIRGGGLFAYLLPLATGAAPIATIFGPLPVLGGGQVSWGDTLAIGGVAPTPDGTALWVADPRRNRVFRIRDPLTAPVVDVILGQTTAAGTSCNQGSGTPSRTSLCQPGSVVLDHQGNVWVSDDALELTGNFRLLEYDASLFPARPAAALLGVPATRVLGTNGSFTGTACQDALCGPWEPAFSRDGHMVVGLNGYIGSKLPLVYDDPLQDPHPQASLRDFQSMAYAAAFDGEDNLYVADLNRDRVLVYLRPFG